jgi:hypothetical protein
METIRQSAFLLAVQIIVAAALSGSYAMSWVRRRGSRAQRATWFRAARSMLRLTPLAVALFLGGAAWVLWKDQALPHFGLIWWVAATIPLTLGLRWLLRAGSLQSQARAVPCRRLARLGGWYSAVGVMLGLAALFSVPMGEHVAWFRPAIAALLLVVGACGLLGGLSGKPRPVGAIGTILWLTAWVAVVHETLP